MEEIKYTIYKLKAFYINSRLGSLDNNFIEEYKNANVAGKENNINGSHVSRCCKKVTKSAGGFIWRYKNDIDI